MTPIYQKMSITQNGMGDCFNACISSIIGTPIEETYEVLPGKPGVWYLQWQRWCRERGYKLTLVSKLMPPVGYSIASMTTGRIFPEGHDRAGQNISHACVALNGVVVHDPSLENSDVKDILYYHSLEKVTIDKK